MDQPRNLIPIDSTKIRKKAVKELTATLKKIDQSKADIKVYFKESKPAFQTWYEASCGDLLQKIRKLEDKYRTKEWEVREVFAYAEFHQIPPALAYLRILERKNTPEAERDFDPFYDEEEEGYWESEDRDNKDSSSDREADREENDFGENHNHTEEFEDLDDSNLKKRSKSSNTIMEDLTRLFRKIARFLHPDKNPNLTPEEKDSWNETLKLYQEKDISGLQDILTWIQIKREDGDSEITISDIQSLNKKFKKDLKSIQKEIRSYKKRPDWGFKKKTKLDKKILQKEIEEDLQSEFIAIHMEMEKLDRVLFSWRQYAKSYGLSPEDRLLRD